LKKKISLNWKKYPVGFKLGKNQVHQTRYFKPENWKNPVQIDRGQMLKALNVENDNLKLHLFL
jgi:hypothetical protein